MLCLQAMCPHGSLLEWSSKGCRIERSTIYYIGFPKMDNDLDTYPLEQVVCAL